MQEQNNSYFPLNIKSDISFADENDSAEDDYDENDDIDIEGTLLEENSFADNDTNEALEEMAVEETEDDEAEDEEIIDGACLYWEQLKNTQIRNTGGGTVYELWTENGNAPSFLPKNVKPNENCVTVGWIQMSLMLFYLRRDAKYLDAVETALFNH